jgi:hypothetical protein
MLDVADVDYEDVQSAAASVLAVQDCFPAGVLIPDNGKHVVVVVVSENTRGRLRSLSAGNSAGRRGNGS